MDIFKQRRFWVAVIPVGVMVANAFGIPITEGALNEVADKAVVGVMAVLSLWSYLQPKPPA